MSFNNEISDGSYIPEYMCEAIIKQKKLEKELDEINREEVKKYFDIESKFENEILYITFTQIRSISEWKSHKSILDYLYLAYKIDRSELSKHIKLCITKKCDGISKYGEYDLNLNMYVGAIVLDNNTIFNMFDNCDKLKIHDRITTKLLWVYQDANESDDKYQRKCAYLNTMTITLK